MRNHEVPVIAIDLGKRRIYWSGDEQQVYDWVVERWDRFDFLPLTYPIELGHMPMVAGKGWTLVEGCST